MLRSEYAQQSVYICYRSLYHRISFAAHMCSNGASGSSSTWLYMAQRLYEHGVSA